MTTTPPSPAADDPSSRDADAPTARWSRGKSPPSVPAPPAVPPSRTERITDRIALPRPHPAPARPAPQRAPVRAPFPPASQPTDPRRRGPGPGSPPRRAAENLDVTSVIAAPPETKPGEPPKPEAASSARRVGGVDAARGLALLGMIAVHTVPLTDDNGTVTATGRIAAGTSAALFGVLVGVSVALLTGRRRIPLGAESAPRHALRLLLRGLAVAMVGLALGQAAIGDVDIILTYYGVLFLLAIPLIYLSTRILFALGAVLVVLAPTTNYLLREHLAPFDLIDPSFTALFTDPGGLLTALLFTGAYPAWPWLAYLCVGVAVGRCSLANLRTAAWLTAGGVLIAVFAAVVSAVALTFLGGLEYIQASPGLPPGQLRTALTEGLDGVTPTSTWWWNTVDTAHSSTPLDMAYTIGTSLTVLGAMLLLDLGLDRIRMDKLARVGRGVVAPLAAAGSMTLTFYSLHVVFIGVAPEAEPWLLYLTQVVFSLGVGLLWRRKVGRGPLEAGVSTLIDTAAPPPARNTTHEGPEPLRLQTPIAIAALLLVVASGAGIALVTTPGTSSVLPVATSGQADTLEPDDPPDDPGGAGTETEDDTPDAPGQPVSPEPDDGPDTADTQGPDTDD